MRGEGPIATKRCSFIKAGGERCKGIATGGATLCYAHDPAYAAQRSANARKAGKVGGNGRSSPTSDVTEARAYTKGLISRLLKGDLPRDIAATAFMGINTLIRVIEMERRIKETDELEVRIEALEARQRLEAGRNWRSWHHR
jgi:hypothetical protein